MMDYFEDLLNTIDKSVHSINTDTFTSLLDDVCLTLKRNHKVVGSGLGKNVPICDKFVGTMLSLGLDAAFMHTNTAIHGDIGMVHDGDLVIVLSKSGETKESVYLVNELKKRSITLWSITFNQKSTVSMNTQKTLILSIDHEGDDWDIVPNNSTTMYLIVLQALAIEAGRALGITLEEFRKNHPGGHIGVQLNEKK